MRVLFQHRVEGGPERVGSQQVPSQLELPAQVAAPGMGRAAHGCQVRPDQARSGNGGQKVQRRKHGEIRERHGSQAFA